MTEDERQHQLYRAFAAAGFQRDRKRTKGFRYVGPLSVVGRDISVAITFPNLEFTHLPLAELMHPEEEAPEIVAHLDASGGLCFASEGDVVLDRYDVEGTVLLCIELAKRGLERALTYKSLENEIAAEFQQHWDGEKFYYDLAGDGIYRASYYVFTDGRRVLSQNIAAARRLSANADFGVPQSLPAYVISSTKELTFHDGQTRPKTLSDFEKYLVGEGLCNSARLYQLIGELLPSAPLIFLRAPNGCVGIQITDSVVPQGALQRKSSAGRLFQTHAAKQKITRLSGSRIDLEFIFERNMHHQRPLTGKHIALIGCGTIGSHLAKMLVQSGAGHEGGSLLLLDYQQLEPGNIGRHYLGMPDIGKSKVEALKVELKRQFPDASISSMRQEAVSYLPHLHSRDVIVDATGEEALSIAINEHFLRLGREGKTIPPRLHAWLFGNGAAAQALFVDGSEYACFRCLKAGHPLRWRFDPMKSGESAETTAAACGEGRFIPYGVAAPIIAAGVALQLVLDWANGDPSPRLRTMSIDKRTTKTINDKNAEKSKTCPACGAAGD